MIYNEGYAAEPQPRYIYRAKDSRVWDWGGRKMIDLAMGGGSMILGHANPQVTKAVQRQAERGSVFTAPHAGAHEMDELLDRFIPWLPARVWCNSGSEAVMRLCRIARAVTGKHKIGLFSGCWHGSWDGTLVEENCEITGELPAPVMRKRSPGVPGRPSDTILFLPYRDAAAFDLIRENAGDLACVLIEPVQGSCPSYDARPFLTGLRKITRDCGVMLAFDEVVTGFRLAPGGGQERFGVHADLAAYGKILGGGLPVGMVAGTKDIMDEARRLGVFFGGTFSANPLTIAAGCATLALLGPRVYEAINWLGASLRERVNVRAGALNLPIHMMGCGSINRLVLSRTRAGSRRQRDQAEPDAAAQSHYYDLVRASGVHIGSNRIQFLSAVHTEAEVEEIARTLCSSAQPDQTEKDVV